MVQLPEQLIGRQRYPLGLMVQTSGVGQRPRFGDAVGRATRSAFDDQYELLPNVDEHFKSYDIL